MRRHGEEEVREIVQGLETGLPEKVLKEWEEPLPSWNEQGRFGPKRKRGEGGGGGIVGLR